MQAKKAQPKPERSLHMALKAYAMSLTTEARLQVKGVPHEVADAVDARDQSPPLLAGAVIGGPEVHHILPPAALDAQETCRPRTGQPRHVSRLAMPLSIDGQF
jgi:hypothetical protein